MTVTLVLGGARSGKSRFAESLAFAPKTYIATGQAFDDEMRQRIALHKSQRGEEWRTIEEPVNLPQELERLTSGFVLVDCLTLWLSNLMLADLDWQGPLDQLAKILGSANSHVVLVSNEVGLGIVPDTPLGRKFRDAQGVTNQCISQIAENVILLVAGIPLAIKGSFPAPPLQASE
jgi:adenosylcobinamide kinase / adenosylcobinamide-phosphate guanylyltransferase